MQTHRNVSASQPNHNHASLKSTSGWVKKERKKVMFLLVAFFFFYTAEEIDCDKVLGVTAKHNISLINHVMDYLQLFP